MARVSKRIKETANYLLGKVTEPTYTALNSDKGGLIDGLNYYSIFSDKAHSKKWALKWVKKNMPELHDKLKEHKDWRFRNRGFVCRMIERGYVPSDQELQNLRDFFTKLAKTPVKTQEEILEEERKALREKLKPVKVNKALEAFDLALDKVVTGQPYNLDLGVDRKEFAEVKAQIKKLQEDLEVNAEAYDKKQARKIKKFLAEVEEKMATTSRKVVRRAPRGWRQVPPSKVVSKLPWSKKDAETGLEGINPTQVVGASKCIVYNAKYRFLMYFEAANADGLTFSGASIKNYDPEKSFFKKVRKPEDMAKEISGKSVAQIKKYLNELSNKPFVCKARFNETCVIITKI